MWRGLFAVFVVAGCWSQDPLIDGAFTPEQWAQLKVDLAFPRPTDPCTKAGIPQVGAMGEPRCAQAISLARDLFGDPTLSGGHCSLTTTKACFGPSDCPNGETCPFTPTSCATCHDQKHGWIDPRASLSPWASGGKVTSRNAMTLWDLNYKPSTPAYTWNGKYSAAGGVLDLAITKPMVSSHARVVQIVEQNNFYANLYLQAFGSFSDTETVFANLEKAFTAYLSGDPFLTLQTPFDLWLAGLPSPMTDSAKHGFAVFVGKGTCITCHSGPMFSDFKFHNTGVPQVGPAMQDNGRYDITMDPADMGAFLTGSLREIANTAPYMHDGAFATLDDVVAFYRKGGETPAEGKRDLKIQALDLTDQDAQDLVAFLNSLTQCNGMNCPMMGGGGPGGPSIDAPAAPPWPDAGPACMQPYISCGGGCVDPQFDGNNCGACGNVCMAGTFCNFSMCQPVPPPPDAGTCVPQTCASLNAQCGTLGDGCGALLNCGMCTPGFSCNAAYQCACPTGTSLCGASCVDLQTDKNNCGTCGHTCVGSHTCVNGTCM